MNAVRLVMLCGKAGLRDRLLEALDADAGIEVVGDARTFTQLPMLARARSAHVVIADLAVPGTARYAEHLTEGDVNRADSLVVISVARLARGTDPEHVSVLPKPPEDCACADANFARQLAGAVRAAAAPTREEVRCDRAPRSAEEVARDAPGSLRRSRSGLVRPKAVPSRPPALIVIGASTGGNEALATLFSDLPDDLLPIMIVQHIPAAFAGALARRLDAHSSIRTVVAQDRERLKPGHAYLSPGEAHLRVDRDGGYLRARLGGSERVNGHCPSVDVLFESATVLGPRVLAVLLTGMGNDGARGMLAMHEAGARTVIQDEASSVVWGMPARALEIGAAQEMLPLKRIHQKVSDFGRQR